MYMIYKYVCYPVSDPMATRGGLTRFINMYAIHSRTRWPRAVGLTCATGSCPQSRQLYIYIYTYTYK